MTVIAQYKTAMQTFGIVSIWGGPAGAERGRLTMLSVPTKTRGGVAAALTMSLMKFAVIPMMARSEAI